MKESVKTLLAVIIILAAIVLSIHEVSFFTNTMKYDMMNQFLPCRYFISECLHNHILPLWCPFINFGYPFHADPQSGVFYPLTFIVSYLGGYNVYAINLEYVLHLCIAAIAFFYFLRSQNLSYNSAIVFGVTYALSGLFIGNAQHLTWVITMAWMPLIILYFKCLLEKPGIKNALGLAVFSYLGLTGGYPGFFIILFYFFTIYALWYFVIYNKAGISAIKPALLFLVIGLGILLVLCCGYLYSFIQSLPYITRGRAVDLIEAYHNPLSPKAMVSLLFPFATACSSLNPGTDISMANAYCGFLLLPLLIISVTKVKMDGFRVGIFAFSIICLMASAGEHFVVTGLFYKFLPGLNMIRQASIYRAFTIFGFVFLSSLGFDWFLKSLQAGVDLFFIKKLLLAYLVLLAIIVMAAFVKTQSAFSIPLNAAAIFDFNKDKDVFAHIFLQGLFQLALVAVIVVLVFLKHISFKSKANLMAGIMLIEIFTAAQLNLPATAISNDKPSVLQASLNRMPKGFPVPELKPMNSFHHLGDGSTIPIWYNVSFFKKIPAVDGLNHFYLEQVDRFYAETDSGSTLLKKPIIYFDNDSVLYHLTRFGPNTVEIQYTSAALTAISLMQNYYPGWQARCDSAPIGLNKVEHAFMHGTLPKGQHTVLFSYQPKGLPFLYALNLLLFAAAFFAFVLLQYQSQV